MFFLSKTFLPKVEYFGVKIPSFWKFRRKVEILSTLSASCNLQLSVGKLQFLRPPSPLFNPRRRWQSPTTAAAAALLPRPNYTRSSRRDPSNCCFNVGLLIQQKINVISGEQTRFLAPNCFFLRKKNSDMLKFSVCGGERGAIGPCPPRRTPLISPSSQHCVGVTQSFCCPHRGQAGSVHGVGSRFSRWQTAESYSQRLSWRQQMCGPMHRPESSLPHDGHWHRQTTRAHTQSNFSTSLAVSSETSELKSILSCGVTKCLIGFPVAIKDVTLNDLEMTFSVTRTLTHTTHAQSAYCSWLSLNQSIWALW